jgi:cysteine desulfuration protein SufE
MDMMDVMDIMDNRKILLFLSISSIMSIMSINEKQKKIIELFAGCATAEERYNKIIELGQGSKRLAADDRVPENLVKGCQSLMYLKTEFDGERIYFTAESDALISAGLAALLIMVYSGETPEVVLKSPPTYLEEIGITAALSPNRANGLYSLHLRMKQEALKCIMS